RGRCEGRDRGAAPGPWALSSAPPGRDRRPAAQRLGRDVRERITGSIGLRTCAHGVGSIPWRGVRAPPGSDFDVSTLPRRRRGPAGNWREVKVGPHPGCDTMKFRDPLRFLTERSGARVRPAMRYLAALLAHR